MLYRIVNRRLEVDPTDEGDYEDFCENVFVSNISKDLISGKENVTITLQHENGEDELIDLPHQAIGAKIISKLSAHGFTCVDNRENNDFLQLILLESKKAVSKKEYFHKKLGFVKKKNGKELFLLYNPIGEKVALRQSSKYMPDEDVKPHGSLTGWRWAVKKYVYGQGFAELALAIGATAPIAHILREGNFINEVPLVALIGRSTSGKTTAMILMSSIWYSKKRISDFNCTKNAFFKSMCESKGVPILIDEASAVPDWDFTNVLYNLPTGEDKRRCLGDGSLQERKKFSGVIVFTGERSIFEQTNSNRGLDARLLELTLPWTESAEHAENIVLEFSKHYGVAAQPLMQWVLANKQLIRKKYAMYKDDLEEMCQAHVTDDVILRLIKIPAMILTAAYALNHALNLFLDIKNIKETLCYVIAAKGEKVKNSPETWHEQLLHIVLDNADKIPYPDDIPKTRKIWGFHGKHKTEAIIWVREDIFEKWLMTIAPTEFDKAKKLLADKELIYYSNRHYKVKRKILGAELNFYGIYLTKPKKRGTRNVSSTKINVSLLE